MKGGKRVGGGGGRNGGYVAVKENVLQPVHIVRLENSVRELLEHAVIHMILLALQLEQLLKEVCQFPGHRLDYLWLVEKYLLHTLLVMKQKERDGNWITEV